MCVVRQLSLVRANAASVCSTAASVRTKPEPKPAHDRQIQDESPEDALKQGFFFLQKGIASDTKTEQCGLQPAPQESFVLPCAELAQQLEIALFWHVL